MHLQKTVLEKHRCKQSWKTEKILERQYLLRCSEWFYLDGIRCVPVQQNYLTSLPEKCGDVIIGEAGLELLRISAHQPHTLIRYHSASFHFCLDSL